MNETIGAILIGIGLAFDFVGTVGLVRFPDMYNRLQAATKCVTLGTATLLIGAAVYTGLSALAAKAVLCAAFILLTSPVAAHAIARGAHIAGVRLWPGSTGDAYLHEREKQEMDHAKTETT